MGRHRKTRRAGVTFAITTFQFTFMILFGTLGVLCVLAAELLGHRRSGRHAG
jgi:hypothetical protein